MVAKSIDPSGASVETPFRVAGDTSIRVHLPVLMNGETVEVSLRDFAGRHLFGPFNIVSREEEALLLNATGDQRLSSALVNEQGGIRGTTRVQTSHVDSATGDVFFPERPSTYRSANLVLLRSDQLTSLKESQLRALFDYVRIGGNLAVAISRNWDVHQEPVSTLAGGRVRVTTPNELMRLEVRDSITREVIEPDPFVEASLMSFSGGRLRPASHGATAPFGRGRVHLLGFDPTQSPGVYDRWAIRRMGELADSAAKHPRRSRETDSWNTRSPPMRKVLDPNEAGRWAIVTSVLLIVAFGVLAGPVLFRRCVRKGHPLRPFWLLPLWSVAFFGVVLVVGGVVKGWPGQARQLAFIEAESGWPRAPAVRFHVVFRANPGPFTIRASEPDGIVTPSEPRQRLEVGGNGMRLAGLTTASWSTVIAREDGFADLGRGVRVLPEDKDVRIVNLTEYDLRAVVVAFVSSELRLFDVIGQGASVLATQGRLVGRLEGKRPALPNSLLAEMNGVVAGLGDAWRAVEASRENAYPRDVPTVLAMVEGYDTAFEGPLKRERQHVLLRVTGEGGEP